MAVGPVCAGINLEYYFSTVDNERLGAGTKLPHNVTGLIAVMNGAGSDLRTGLPKQMIEIHEPVRLQLIVDAAPQTLTAILSRQPPLAELFNNAWVQLIAVDPDSGQASVYRDGRHFAPWQPHEPPPPTGAEASDTARSLEPVPQTATSRDWFLGKRHHIPPALIAAPSQGTARSEGKKSS